MYVRKCMESLSTGEAVVTSLQVARAIIEVLPSFTTYDAGSCANSSHGRSVARSSGTPYPIPHACPFSQFIFRCCCGAADTFIEPSMMCLRCTTLGHFGSRESVVRFLLTEYDAINKIIADIKLYVALCRCLCVWDDASCA